MMTKSVNGFHYFRSAHGISLDWIPLDSFSKRWVARSRADTCVRAGSIVGILFRDEFCDGLPRRPWLAQFGHDKQLCVSDQRMDIFFSSASLTVGALKIGLMNARSQWDKLWLD